MNTHHLDELNSMTQHGGIALQCRGRRRSRKKGGEWDRLFEVPDSDYRILVGTRWIRSTGEPPDVFAELMGFDNPCDAIDWYVKTALKAVVERKRLEHWCRHHKFAISQGAKTYFDYRDTLAIIEGYTSFWYKRKRVK